MSFPIPAHRTPYRIVLLTLFALLCLPETVQAQDQPTTSLAQAQQPVSAPAAPSTNQPASPTPTNPASASPTSVNQTPNSQTPANSGNAAPQPPQAAPASSLQPAAGAVETPAVVVEGTTDTILGKPVVSASGDDMGRIVDVMVDQKGMVRAAIIDFGGFLGVGTRKIAVDWRALHFPKSGAMDKIVAELSQDQLRVAPAYKPGEAVVIIGSGDATPQPNPANPATPAPASGAGTPAAQPIAPTSPPAATSTPNSSSPAPSAIAPSAAPSSTPATRNSAPIPGQDKAPVQTP